MIEPPLENDLPLCPVAYYAPVDGRLRSVARYAVIFGPGSRRP